MTISLIPRTPLDAWIAGLIGEPRSEAVSLDSETLTAWQLAALNETLGLVRRHSPFYRERLAGVPQRPRESLAELSRLPCTSPEDLRDDPLRFLCGSQAQVAHVVTLQTSGTSSGGAPKRLFFGARDLERTVDFFRHGMRALVEPGQRVMTLMPGPAPGSVGGLLTRALASLDVINHVHGLVLDPEAAVLDIRKQGSHCLVGLPSQVLALGRYLAAKGRRAPSVSRVLLSGEYAPEPLCREVESLFGCQVFRHYGLTETGFGGGVECAARRGYHLREADLLLEIVDPAGVEPVAEGQWGEVVITTLQREVMPLLRYRTGDLARFIPEPCPCGSKLRRLDSVVGRLDEAVPLPGGGVLRLHDLLPPLLAVPELLHMQATLHSGAKGARLELTGCITPVGDARKLAGQLRAELTAVPPLSAASDRGLALDLELHAAWPWSGSRPAKPRIIVNHD